MRRHVISLVLVVLMTGFVLAQQQPQGQTPLPPVSQDEHHHLSKREKREMKKERDEERKAEKHRRKRDAKEHKRAEKELAKQRKREDDAEKKDIAKKRAEVRKRDRKAEEKELAQERHEQQKQEAKLAKERHDDRNRGEKERAEASNGGDHTSMVGRTASLAGRTATAPFRLALHATPPLLRAQRDVSRAIYSQFPASNVAVMLSDAGQIILRGAAPSPSLRSRLLQLAVGAAGGYPIVDQLAAEFVGDAASAAVGKVSDMIHGDPDSNGSDVPPAADANPRSAYGPPASEPAAAGASAFEGGTRACANVLSNNRVVLTGQTTSQANAEAIRQFALQLGGSSATLDDQLMTRTNGSIANDAMPRGSSTTDTLPLTPGSTVCVNLTAANDVLLTGTVASSTELSTVERAAQSLATNARLTDQLTIGTLPATSTAAATGGASGTAVTAAADTTAANTTTKAETVTSAGIAAPVSAVDSELEQALHSLPRLANVDVELSGDTVRLSGTVDTTQDDQTARDIARQHAPGRSVVDNLTVAGRAPAPIR